MNPLILIVGGLAASLGISMLFGRALRELNKADRSDNPLHD